MEEFSEDEYRFKDVFQIKNEDKLHNYWNVLVWVIRWVAKKHPYYLLLIINIGGISLVLQALTLGGVFYLIDGIKNNAINIYDYSIDLHYGYNFLFLIFILILLLFFSGIGQRFYNKSVNNLSVVYERYLKESVIQKLQNNQLQEYFGEHFKQSLFLRYLNPNARVTGRTLIVFLTSLLDIVKIIFFLAICLFLELKITLLLFVLIIPVGILFYKMNRKIHMNEINLEKYQQGAAEEGREVFQEISKHKKTRKTCQIGDKSIKSLEAYLNRLNFIEQAEMIGHLGLTIGIAVGMTWVYYEYIYGKGEMASIIVYLFSLKLLLVSTKSLVHSLSVYTRHFRKVRELYEVLSK